MDKASAYRAGDCRFESCRGHLSYRLMSCVTILSADLPASEAWASIAADRVPQPAQKRKRGPLHVLPHGHFFPPPPCLFELGGFCHDIGMLSTTSCIANRTMSRRCQSTLNSSLGRTRTCKMKKLWVGRVRENAFARQCKVYGRVLPSSAGRVQRPPEPYPLGHEAT